MTYLLLEKLLCPSRRQGLGKDSFPALPDMLSSHTWWDLSFSKTSEKPWVWAELISWNLWRPQRGLVHLWAGAASFRVRWSYLEDCRATSQEYLLQTGSDPPLLKPLLSFLTTWLLSAWLLSLNVLYHCNTSKWSAAYSRRRTGQNKLYLVTLFVASTTV